jgi:hypothetical protein
VTLSLDELDKLVDRQRANPRDAEAKLQEIPDLQVSTYLELSGFAVVSGTAEAVAKALELDCVRSAAKGHRPIFRGATRQ